MSFFEEQERPARKGPACSQCGMPQFVAWAVAVMVFLVAFAVSCSIATG